MESLIFPLKVAILVGMSSIYSGLNISLMSLSQTDLERKAKLGNKQAQRVLPFRKNSHLSLAAILLANVAVISATSLVIDEKFGGLIAGIASTLLIVIFGEVVPQAVFARYALRVTSFLAPLLKLTTIVTYPISKPLQLALDKLFGHSEHQLHSRNELGMIISDHAIDNRRSELDEGEIKILRSTLLLSQKRVKEIMTPMSHVYWFTNKTIINADVLDDIKARSWSRIPVFDEQLTKCYGVLLAKDLLDIDFDKNPKKVTSLPLHSTQLVGSMTALDTMLRRFANISTHMVPVERDDKIVGILTLEDLIEEILGHEIQDESDHIKNTNR